VEHKETSTYNFFLFLFPAPLHIFLSSSSFFLFIRKAKIFLSRLLRCSLPSSQSSSLFQNEKKEGKGKKEGGAGSLFLTEPKDQQRREEKSEKSDKFSVAMLLVIRIFRSLAAGLINLVFPYLVLTDLHYTSFILGLVYTAGTVGTAFLGLVSGFMADFHRKVTYLFALVLLPVSSAMLLISPKLPFLFLAAIIGGYSATGSLAGGGIGGAAQPIQSTVTSDVTSRAERTFYYGLLSFTAGVSSAGGAFMGGNFSSIEESLVIATIFGAFSVVPVFFIRRTKTGRSIRNSLNRKEILLRQLKLKSRSVIGKFGITGLFNGLANGLLIPFLIPFFILVYGISRNEMGVYTSISGLIGAFALLIAPKIERSVGFLKGVIFTRGTNAVLALVFPFVRVLPISLGIYFIFPALRVAAFPIIQTALVDMVDEAEVGRAFGINQASRLSFSSTGSAFSGYEFDNGSVEVPFVFYAAILGFNLYLYSRFFASYKDPLMRI
jgi:MFS family permease